MNSEDRLRQAFEDLERRTESVDPRYSLQRLPRNAERRAWVPALAGAGAVLAVIGVVAVAGLLTGPETDDVVATPSTLDTAVTSSTEPEVTTTITVPVVPLDTASYPTHRVVGVADDDVLNVRSEPGASADLVAVLPPSYAGIRAIDNVAIVEDGGEWRQIELLDPTRVIDGGELDGQRLTGWVNTAFIEEYDPSQPDVFPCEHDIGPMPEPTGEAPDHVYSIRQFGLGGCLRTVVTFGQEFDTGYWPIDGITTDMRPAGTPGLVRHQVNGTTVFVLEGVPYAWDPQSGT
ncbi:MAG TPA: SH3 domain-containing protein, partial [Acidimicrobiia bacterium]|nr:SH3 domain-containing protein [Acidimicrobiia bacterium]